MALIRFNKRNSRRRGGMAMVEMVIILPVLFMLLKDILIFFKFFSGAKISKNFQRFKGQPGEKVGLP